MTNETTKPTQHPDSPKTATAAIATVHGAPGDQSSPPRPTATIALSFESTSDDADAGEICLPSSLASVVNDTVHSFSLNEARGDRCTTTTPSSKASVHVQDSPDDVIAGPTAASSKRKSSLIPTTLDSDVVIDDETGSERSGGQQYQQHHFLHGPRRTSLNATDRIAARQRNSCITSDDIERSRGATFREEKSVPASPYANVVKTRAFRGTILWRWKTLMAFIAGFYMHNLLLLMYRIQSSSYYAPESIVSSSASGDTKFPNEDWESNAPPNSKSIILNILVDDNGSCPDNCVYIHKLLPSWVQFRYMVFSNQNEDLSNIHNGLINSMENKSGHVLIVARYHVIEIANWASYHKKHTNASVGMFLMSDEELLRHNRLVDANLYTSFDYVLRNYYFNANQMGDIPLRFLGNATCGTSLPLPSNPSIPGPRWGLHWVFLQPHEWHVLLDRPHQSIEPARMRPKNCSFVGWMGGNRYSKEDRAQVRKLSHKKFQDLNCDVALSNGFGKNKFNHSKLWYLNNDLAQSKIGLNPRGVHPECHRLPEMLSLGTVPAMTKQDYMQYTFQPIPGIVANDWMEVFAKMRYYLGSGIDELSGLSYRAAIWMKKLEACMKSDMDLILRGVFGA